MVANNCRSSINLYSAETAATNFSSTNLTFYRHFLHNYTLYLYLLCSYIFIGSKGVLFIYIFLVLSVVLRILVLRVSDNMEAILDFGLGLTVVSTVKN